ncbi:MAG: DUF167 family protein [Rhizobiaceae bacterium]
MFFRQTEDGIALFVRLTPRGGGDRIDGVRRVADGREYLAVRVRAAPEKGAANAALEVLLAKSMGMPKSAVSVTAGHTARVKTVRLAGDPDQLSRLMTDIGTGR